MFNFGTKKIFSNREVIITAVFILLCLALAGAFPSEKGMQGITKSLFFFFLIPIAYIKIVLGKKVSDFGLNIENKKTGLFWGSIMLAVSLIIFYLLANYTSLPQNYELPILAVNNFWFFLLYIAVFSGITFFFQEFFFRGFILAFFSQRAGFWSVAIQALLYFLIIIIGAGGFSKEIWQFTPYFILSITGGVTAYKSQSMIFSWISGLLFLIMANSYIIYIIKA